MFGILEEKIDQVVKKMEVLSQENSAFKQEIEEKKVVIKGSQERIDVLEEEKALVREKIEGMLAKINQVLS